MKVKTPQEHIEKLEAVDSDAIFLVHSTFMIYYDHGKKRHINKGEVIAFKYVSGYFNDQQIYYCDDKGDVIHIKHFHVDHSSVRRCCYDYSIYSTHDVDYIIEHADSLDWDKVAKNARFDVLNDPRLKAFKKMNSDIVIKSLIDRTYCEIGR